MKLLLLSMFISCGFFVSCYCWGQKKDSCSLCYPLYTSDSLHFVTHRDLSINFISNDFKNKKYVEVSKDGILTVYDSLETIVSLMKLLGVEVKGFKRDDSKEIYQKYIRENNRGISDSNNKYFKLLNKK